MVASGALARAAAAGITVDLAFEVEPEARGCPDADSFRASVRRQLGYDPFASWAERTVAVSIAHRPNGFNGRIHWSDASGHWAGERRLSSRKPDCASLAQDLAFSVAVQVQLLATLAPVESKPAAGERASVGSTPPSLRREGSAPAAVASPVSPQPIPAERPSASLPAATPPPLVPREEATSAKAEEKVPVAEVSSPASPTQASGPSGVSLWVGLGPSLAWALAPRSTPVGRLFVDVRGAWISLELAVDAAWPVTHEIPKRGGFELERASGSAALCGHARAFLGCVLAGAGVLRAAGVGVDVPSSPTGGFYQLGARLGARVPFGGRYFAGLRMDGLWSPAPWTIDVNGTPMWTTPRLGALVGVDVGAIFF